jgi:small redox-active disulfide protein 2
MKMMKLQILGPGCRNCQSLAANTESAARQLGLEYELEKITSPLEIARFGIVKTPALAIDGQVKVSGRVPDVTEITTILTSWMQ